MKKVKILFGALAITAAMGLVSCYTGSQYEEPETNKPADPANGGGNGQGENDKDATGFKNIEMKKIEAGSFKFKYGAADEAEEVNLGAFNISSTEITQELYEKIMGTNPSDHKDGAADGEVQEKRPVDCVSFYAALVFCNKLSVEEGLTPVYKIKDSTDTGTWGDIPTTDDNDWNAVTEVEDATGFRLPHEKEWMFAALGSNAIAFSGFDERFFSGFAGEEEKDKIDDYAWYLTTKEGGDEEKGNSEKTTHEVAKKLPNSNGVYDMTGNVWELCWDYINKAEHKHARHGGGFNQEYLGHYSVSARWDIPAHEGWGDVGFRVVCSASAKPGANAD